MVLFLLEFENSIDVKKHSFTYLRVKQTDRKKLNE